MNYAERATHKCTNFSDHVKNNSTPFKTACKIENKTFAFGVSAHWDDVDCKNCLKKFVPVIGAECPECGGCEVRKDTSGEVPVLECECGQMWKDNKIETKKNEFTEIIREDSELKDRLFDIARNTTSFMVNVSTDDGAENWILNWKVIVQ